MRPWHNKETKGNERKATLFVTGTLFPNARTKVSKGEREGLARDVKKGVFFKAFLGSVFLCGLGRSLLWKKHAVVTIFHDSELFDSFEKFAQKKGMCRSHRRS